MQMANVVTKNHPTFAESPSKVQLSPARETVSLDASKDTIKLSKSDFAFNPNMPYFDASVIKYIPGKNYTLDGKPVKNWLAKLVKRSILWYHSKTRYSKNPKRQQISFNCCYPQFHILSCSEYMLVLTELLSSKKGTLGAIEGVFRGLKRLAHCVINGAYIYKYGRINAIEDPIIPLK